MDDLTEKRRLSLEKVLKEKHPKIDFERIYEEKYKDEDFYTIICQLQPLINEEFYASHFLHRFCNGHSDERGLHLFFAYFRKGGDPEYFTSGAGAPGNCCIL